MKKIVYLFVIAVFVITASVSGCADKNEKSDDTAQVENTSTDNVNNQENTTDVQQNNTTSLKDYEGGEVYQLTSEEFRERVFDYQNNQEWKYEGDKPCIVDFYADWCRPCKMIEPIMEELAKEYKGKVLFYRVNVDNEREVAGVFGIQSIPSVLFVPVDGQPQMATGAMQKEGYVSAIEQVFGIK